MQYRVLTDTVLPLSGAPFSPRTFTPVLPRLSPNAPLCPDMESYRLACKGGALNIVLTAPAQLSGSYAAARAALLGRQDAAILDSRTFGAGQLLLASYAAERAQQDRFSARVLRDVRKKRRAIRCFFTAPDGEAIILAGGKKAPILSPFHFPVFTVGSEGEIRLYRILFSRSSADALYTAVRPFFKKGVSAAIVHDRCEKEAQRLFSHLSVVCGGILRGESIRTDLPFGRGGFLSAAFFQLEE